MLELIYGNGPKRGQAISIADQSVIFGRSESTCQVALSWDASISSRHFEITRQGDQFVLVDLRSRNGTRLNGRVVERAALSDMDRIEAGTTLLIVRHVETRSVSARPTGPTGRNSSPIEDSSWKSRGGSPIEGSFADFKPVRELQQSPIGGEVPDAGEIDEAIWERSSFRTPARQHGGDASSTSPPANANSSHTPSPASPLPASPSLPPNLPAINPVSGQSAATPKLDGGKQQASPQVIRQVRFRIHEGYGPVLQRLYWIGPGEMLTLGRGSQCDCALPHDGRLSMQHFMIQCTDHTCKITDLHSDDGTWLNGARIQEAQLHHGDTIWAGACVFIIEIQTLGGFLLRQPNSGEAEAPPNAASAGTPLPKNAVPFGSESTPLGRPAATRLGEAPKVSTVPITEQVLAEDVVALAGEFSEALTPGDLLKRLMELGSVYLLIDLSRITLPYPQNCDCHSSKLFEWLPVVAAVRTPNLFKTTELADPVAYWEESLGCDAVVCLISPLPKPQLLETLRELCRDPNSGNRKSRGIVGFCWPSSLKAIMDQGTFGLSNKLFESVHCVLTEADDANKWRLCVREKVISERLVKRWRESGLHLTVAEPT